MVGVRRDGTIIVQEILPIDNGSDADRRRRFLISPAQYLRAERVAAERRKDLIGFYHSHPDHPAAPSAFDREHALPRFAYVIVSVEGGEAGETTAWLLSDDRESFAKETIQEEGASP
jgi:proteasome lid subunit RPN8/RPN11